MYAHVDHGVHVTGQPTTVRSLFEDSFADRSEHEETNFVECFKSRMTVVTAPLPLSDDHPDELLSRTLTPPTETSTELPFAEIYEIERTRRLLKEGSFRTVALQFPDDLLHDAAEISKRLQDGIEGLQTYILADTSYGRLLVQLKLF